MNRARLYGFTLIELMTVVVVIAILVAVAYPSYEDHVRKGKRAEGKAALLKAAQVLERAYSDGNTYPTDLAPLFGRTAGQAVYSGENPAGGSYCITVAVGANSTYTLTATPSAAAAPPAPCAALAGGFKDPTTGGCGNLTLTNTGVRNKTGDKPMSSCW
jgi:type IV pilus assembly protein PilE